MTPTTACEVCGGPPGLGRLTSEGLCAGCEARGHSWAHRQLVRLWNAGLTEVEIERELGYRRGVVRTIITRLRSRGVTLVYRRPGSVR